MHHPSDLTFYDELGVASDASPEEIRNSFRALVRMVHPDHHPDLNLKTIAERQMRKLNRVYAVLSDPEKRRRYDAVLEEKNFGGTIVLSPDARVNVQRLKGRLAWFGAMLLTAVTLIWLASESPGARPVQSSERPAQSAFPAKAVTGASGEVDQLRAELRTMKAERDLAVRELVRLRGSRSAPTGTIDARPDPPSPVATTLTELPSPVLPLLAAGTAPAHVPAVRLAPAVRQGTAGRSFIGFWFYTKQEAASRTKSSLYPPDFIEASITVEQNGQVHGKYRSRYKIVDRAISPDVNFEFSGNPVGPVLVAPWTGLGGSKGEITLKMTGDNAMKVDWSTFELGSIQGLITGTATLTRKIE